MGKNKKSIPTAPPQPSKEARSEKVDRGLTPVWAFQSIDTGGRWNWLKLEESGLPDVIAKMGEFEKMDWALHKQNGSHPIPIAHLCGDAQRRLAQIKQDDAGSLYSFRFTGKQRMWGIRDNNVIRLLWWDPEHQVCPSLK